MKTLKKIMVEYGFTVNYDAGDSEIGSDSARIVSDTTVDADSEAAAGFC